MSFVLLSRKSKNEFYTKESQFIFFLSDTSSLLKLIVFLHKAKDIIIKSIKRKYSDKNQMKINKDNNM